MIITLDDAKAHLRVTDDTEDALITSYIGAAQGYLAGFVDCATDGDDVPAEVQQAARLLVGTMYDSRETAVIGANIAVLAGPIGVLDLISGYRTWAF